MGQEAGSVIVASRAKVFLLNVHQQNDYLPPSLGQVLNPGLAPKAGGFGG